MHKRGIVLSVHVQPNAPRTEVQGIHGDALKLRLAAPPVEGKANETLTKWLADRLDVARSALELIGGEKDRRKRVLITDTRLPLAEVERLLLPPDRG